MEARTSPPVHSCGYCRDFILGQFDLPLDQSRASIGQGRKYVWKKPSSYSELCHRSQDGCVFFQIILSNAPPAEPPAEPIVNFCFHLLKPLRVNKYLCKLEWEWESSKDSRSFQVFAVTGNEASRDLNLGPPVRNRTSESDTWKNWLEECDCLHENCELVPDYKPSRLLFVGVHGDDVLRLIDTHPGMDSQYAALSYCWGTDQTYKTTKESRKAYEQAIPLSALSTFRTITDAIHVARGLEIQYLWIDALCIVQDDPDDVNRELAKMRSIYEGAYLTITAGCTTSSKDGFLDSAIPMPEHPDIEMRFLCQDGSEGSVLLQSQENYTSRPADDPISARGWTLQEDLLSPRVLHFGPYKVRWRCATKITTDRGGEPQYLSVDEIQSLGLGAMSQLAPKTTNRRWIEIVQNYTRRNLTVQSDKLPALAGIADRFSQVLPSQYLAGIWAADLHRQLLWYKDAPFHRPSYRAPSWSWASSEGEVSYSGEHPVHVLSRLELLDCSIELESEQLPFGKIQSALMRARGRVRQIDWSRSWRGTNSGFFFRFRPDFEDPDDDLNDTGLIPDSTEDKELLEQGTPTVWVLEVTTELTDSPSGPVVCLSHGIALVQAAGECFKRIGRFKHSRVVDMPESMMQDQALDYYDEDYDGPTAFWVSEDGDEEDSYYWNEEQIMKMPWEEKDWFRNCEIKVMEIV